jgi:hypothetical protein
MKTKIALSTLILGLALMPAARAGDQEDVGRSQEPIKIPAALRIVEPVISSEHVGESVEMIFTIRKDGRPTAVRCREAFPRAGDLAEKLEAVIPMWRFEPARDHLGRPVEVTAVLPVRVSAGKSGPTVVAHQAADQVTVKHVGKTQNPIKVPAALRIVEPVIAWEHVGESVEMVFTIRKDGRPTAICCREAFPKNRDLAEQLKAVITRWRFEPARDHLGRPVEVTAVLPVRVIAHGTKPTVAAHLEIVSK